MPSRAVSPTQVASLRRLEVVHRSIATTIAGLVLVQAFIAGRHIFGPWGIAVHGVVGNVTFAAGVALAGLAAYLRSSRVTVALSVLLGLSLTAQVGLGYAGRSSFDAAAWHIPNGVLAFGLAVVLATPRQHPPSGSTS